MVKVSEHKEIRSFLEQEGIADLVYVMVADGKTVVGEYWSSDESRYIKCTVPLSEEKAAAMCELIESAEDTEDEQQYQSMLNDYNQ